VSAEWVGAGRWVNCTDGDAEGPPRLPSL